MGDYKNVKTVKELLYNIRNFGRKTDIESVVEMQDIFGHSEVGELIEIANNKNLSNDFYSLLFSIWHWSDAIAFYNQHTNQAVQSMIKENEKLEKSGKENVAIIDKLKTEKNDFMNRYTESLKTEQELSEKLKSLDDELKNRDIEIVKLKAKLYDMMTA